MRAFEFGHARTIRRALGAAFVALSVGCQGTEPVATAVLSGKVFRGPVMPVCHVAESCNSPFSATFAVRRAGQLVGTFTSGDDGSFTVSLPAGELVIVPSPSAPVMQPASQAKTVVLEAGSVTVVELFFDTGIR